ncbi:homeobox protein engrailed-2b [Leptopilina boulardi]|uniref:homeobox protein engrailed-2b n=1 Tax=Leptopilina boulardi TaxID=63433 RepID=UPI0021F5DE40|nr:homeobox protein engrailed-2b [Leptopilina boulardi]
MSEQRITQKTSDFSIERILSTNISFNRKNDFQLRNKIEKEEKSKEEEEEEEEDEEFKKSERLQSGSISNDEEKNQRFGLEKELPWLHCTRYSPPKLPRRQTTKQRKRRLGSQPRIPFTKIQIQILEEKYKINAYLSRRDVIQLGGILNLPQNRVKIWFQNRRARERKETQSNNISVI